MMTSSTTDLDVVEVEGCPKAIVLVLGFMNSQKKHLKKYSELYNARDCSTVTGTADAAAIMGVDQEKINAMAMEYVKHASKLLRDAQNKHNNNKIPLIVHCMSNGGAFVLMALELKIEEAMLNPNSESYDDLILIGERLKIGGEFFDSSPGYPSLRTYVNVMRELVPYTVLQLIIIPIAAFSAIVPAKVASLLTGKPTFTEEFWNHFRESNATTKQAFVYSDDDHMIDHEKIDELIVSRSKHDGLELLSKKVSGSKHVQHLRHHEKEYCQLLDKLLGCAS